LQHPGLIYVIYVIIYYTPTELPLLARCTFSRNSSAWAIPWTLAYQATPAGLTYFLKVLLLGRSFKHLPAALPPLVTAHFLRKLLLGRSLRLPTLILLEPIRKSGYPRWL